jgi:hypothetical protein
MSNNLAQDGMTNPTWDQLEQYYGVLSNMFAVHPPYFGLHWDAVSAPTSKDTNAMDSVNAFIATNGWNMHTGLPFVVVMRTKAIKGLPWEVIKES